MVAAELPVLRGHGVSMWGYAVLSALDEGPVRTQAALAQAIGADKTRIIGVLDELQAGGLLERRADPVDRRVRLVSITERGRELCGRVRAEIQANEERVLGRVPAEDRAAFMRTLDWLAGLPAEEFLGGRE